MCVDIYILRSFQKRIKLLPQIYALIITYFDFSGFGFRNYTIHLKYQLRSYYFYINDVIVVVVIV